MPAPALVTFGADKDAVGGAVSVVPVPTGAVRSAKLRLVPRFRFGSTQIPVAGAAGASPLGGITPRSYDPRPTLLMRKLPFLLVVATGSPASRCPLKFRSRKT